MGPESGHEEVQPLSANQSELVDAENEDRDATHRLDEIREGGIEGQDAGGRYSSDEWTQASADAEAAKQRLDATRQKLAEAGESEPS